MPRRSSTHPESESSSIDEATMAKCQASFKRLAERMEKDEFIPLESVGMNATRYDTSEQPLRKTNASILCPK